MATLVAAFVTLEAQLPIYWVPVLGPLYKPLLSITQEPTIWVPGLLGFCNVAPEVVKFPDVFDDPAPWR